MPGDDAFEVEGSVVEVYGNGTCLVSLANGHRLIGYLTRRVRAVVGELAPGERVGLRLSAYDLSVGRILKRIT